MGKQNKRKAEAEAVEQSKAKAKKEEKKEKVVVQEEPEEEVKEEKTPTELFFDRLKEVMERAGAVGYIAEAGEDDDDDEGEEIDLEELIRSAQAAQGDEGEEEEQDGDDEEEDADEPDAEAEAEGGEEDDEADEDEDEDDEDEDDIVLGDGREYTEEELAELRYVLLTERRSTAMEKMSTLLFGEDEDEINVDKAFSHKLFATTAKEAKKILKLKHHGERFDELLGLTKMLSNIDGWVAEHDDVKALETMLGELGSAWKTVLALKDEQLEIDPEFTRPGVVKLLENFTELVAQNEKNPVFVWQ